MPQKFFVLVICCGDLVCEGGIAKFSEAQGHSFYEPILLLGYRGKGGNDLQITHSPRR